MTCPSCGHANDAGNRFCEYCGARLDPTTVQEATVQQMGPPSFGGDASYDAPTMFVPTENSAAPAEQPAAPAAAPASPPPAAPSAPETSSPAQTQDVICGVCGYANQPDDRFCDQCGASLQSAAQPGAASPPSADALTEFAPVDAQPSGVETAAPAGSDPALMSPWSTNDAEAPTPPQGTPLPTSPAAEPAPASSESLLAEMVMSPISSHELPTTPVPPEPSAEPEAAPEAVADPGASGEAGAERSAIEAIIQEHRDNLAMFEQMTTRYQGRAIPAHISAGLEESRESLTEAEARLHAFDEAQSAAEMATLPDPAELERLTNLVQEHRDNLTMFEQMATRYQGRAIPAHISAGLEESRESLTEAENELAALQGATQSSPPAAPAEATPAAEVAPTSAEATPAAEAELVASALELAPEATQAAAATMPAIVPAESPAPAVAAVVPPAAPEPAPMPVLKPRLMIVTTGATVELPTDKQTIVVGREDPISGIFPEVDLTPHGGEGGGVSRQHARILHDATSWKVEDLNSTNYTKINGTKLAPNTPTEIHDGDTLHFGRVALTFHS